MKTLDIVLEELDNSIQMIDLKNNFTLEKRKNTYIYRSSDNTIASKAQYFDYKIPSFDWVLIANVDTKKKYRRNGLAERLINQIYDDISNIKKGVYVFVNIDNDSAIKLYKKCNFKILKKYKINNEIYFIMYRGNDEKINQFNNISFGN